MNLRLPRKGVLGAVAVGIVLLLAWLATSQGLSRPS
jgi:hypothetical protein